MNPGEETRVLASFVAGMELPHVSEGARLAARLALLNWFGCAIAGAQQPAVSKLLAGLAIAGCDGCIPVLGRSESLNALSAALVNGTASAVLDFDSPQHRKTNIHPSGPIVSAMLAVVAGPEQQTITGSDFLLAYIAGVEIACRIANTVFGDANPGWHVTGVAGGPGAAVAAAKLLRLSEEQIATAIGIAATQGGGLREMYGTMCKALTPGRSGENGLLAALLASQGFNSASAPLEGGKGLAAVFTGLTDISQIVLGLGDSFEVEAMAHKPYPCAVVTHAVIDACIALSEGVDVQQIEAIRLTVSPIAFQLAGKVRPQDDLEAKFSLAHAAATALTYRAARVEHFSHEALKNTEIARLSDMVRIEISPEFRKDEARVQLMISNGETSALYVPHATGSRQNPMTEEQLLKKFLNLTENIIGVREAETLSQMLMNIEDIDDTRLLLKRCQAFRKI